MVKDDIRPHRRCRWTRWRQCALPCGHISATWRIRLNLCFIRVHNPNVKSIGSAVSAQLTAGSPYTLQWAPLSHKIAPSHGGAGPPSNTWFPGHTRVLNLNGISIGLAVFAGLTSMTDRPRYSVGNNRPYTYVVLRCGIIICVITAKIKLQLSKHATLERNSSLM